jgi:hypothetical protein
MPRWRQRRQEQNPPQWRLAFEPRSTGNTTVAAVAHQLHRQNLTTINTHVNKFAQTPKQASFYVKSGIESRTISILCY